MSIKYVVLQPFTDTVTKKLYNTGDFYPANAKKARLEDLQKDEHPWHTGALIKPVKVTAKADETETKDDAEEVKQVEGGENDGGNDDNTADETETKD